MTRTVPALGVLLALALLPPSLEAQAPAQAPTPTHSVVRFFKCNPQGVGVRALQRARPEVQKMIAEGKFIDYGILTHAWGDEWNVVDYFIVAGLDGFFTNFTDLFRRIQAANQQTAPQEGQEEEPSFGEACTEHKDVIYAIVAPPAGG